MFTKVALVITSPSMTRPGMSTCSTTVNSDAPLSKRCRVQQLDPPPVSAPSGKDDEDGASYLQEEDVDSDVPSPPCSKDPSNLVSDEREC